MRCLGKNPARLVLLILFLLFYRSAPGAEPHELRAGDMRLVLQVDLDGIKISDLEDAKSKEHLLASPQLPLFSVNLRRSGSTNETRLSADSGWKDCRARFGQGRLELIWAKPEAMDSNGISIHATATAYPKASAIGWRLEVKNASTNWGVTGLIFPQLAVADLGTNAAVVFPRGPGEVQRGVWHRPFTYRGTYPDGWCSMQFMAAYRESGPGIYVGMHDPWGSTKYISARNDPTAASLILSFEAPAPGLGLPGNGFSAQGEAVWQLLRGDWFDAARIYRTWAMKEAKWWPRLGRDGREDTPAWMRHLNVWAMTGGAPGDCVPAVKRFQGLMGESVGFHWYNWHQIPFDNDYPHYFPAKLGFPEGVAELKSSGVFVMPYINGRLWDSYDRGAEDYEFSRVALPAVTRKEDGAPYIESYGSKETNGQPVRLGVMCPSTPLWRSTISNIVLRLLRECGTSSVYIDQVAAAAPKLCMDSSHGHPLGGGHWWNQGYWKMLEDINRVRPRETMLTTECNGEPFIRWFDGYLTWHWQHDGQVPAFPAVYGGAIQMFGRAYRGGATKDLALRMKAGQQLVYGEQLGWLDPGMLQDKGNAEFFRAMVKLRGQFNRFFSAGEMQRPPRLMGDIPSVKADWQWSGEWWVTTDAVLTGAWALPREHRLVLLFVNVSDAPVRASVREDPVGWGVKGKKLVPLSATPGFGAPVSLAPREGQAWEFRW